MMRHGAVMYHDREILSKVRRFFIDSALKLEGASIVVACSGGPDSLTLLDVLCQLKDSYSLSITACYIHHGIRKAADEEVRMVEEEARKRGCSFLSYRTDVPRLSKVRRQSIETVGRDERYRLLHLAKDTVKADYIAVAHHADDQAETILSHVLRGSGLSGLCGMVPYHDGVIRPFLTVTRKDIEGYVKDHGLHPSLDETNASRQYERNRIRLDLIPLLTSYNPNIVADLNRLGTIAQREESYLEGETERAFTRFVHHEKGEYVVRKRDVMALHPALLRRLLRRMAVACIGRGSSLSFTHTETLCHMVKSHKEGTFTMTNLTVCTDRDYMHFLTKPREEESFVAPAPVTVTGPGTYAFGESVLTVYTVSQLQEKAERGTLYIPSSYIQKGLVLRCRRPGDRIGTRGGTKSLKKYFNELKIPPLERYRRPLLCSGHDVLLIEGVAPSVVFASGQEQVIIACHF